MEDLEQEQLDYIRRNSDKTMHIPKENLDYPDILKEPLDERIVLSPEQEKRLLTQLLEQQKNIDFSDTQRKKIRIVSLSKYFDIITESFVGIMDDLVNFDGDLENFSDVFTKKDRLVFVSTIILLIGVFLLLSKYQQSI